MNKQEQEKEARQTDVHHYWRVEARSGMLVTITPAEYELWGKDNQPHEAYSPAYANPVQNLKPHELAALGCNCIRFGKGNRHWPCKLHPSQPTAEERLNKLLGYMGSNVKEGWDKVCQVAGVCAYVSQEDALKYLDDLPVCNVGLSQTIQEPKE